MGRTLSLPRALVVLCAALGARPAVSQVAGGSSQNQPSWVVMWSPLETRADLPRRLPFVGGASGLLLLPPRVGLFWTAGNPAALQHELSDTLTDFGMTLAHESGSLRRPLDPGAASQRRASAIGWMPLSERVAVLGSVGLAQETFDPGSHADVVEAYPTSPFVTLDTSTSATRNTGARLEGAVSTQFGTWGLGLALGYDALERETINAGLVRRSRRAVPAATLGVTKQIGTIRLGAYARWQGSAESVYLIERAGEGLVIQLEGLREVQPLEILSFYYRRIEETTPTLGWSLGGKSWTLYAERTWLRQRLTRQEADNPAADKWNADAWSAGGAYQHALGPRALLTVDLRYTTLRGDGDLALDSSGVIFRATERAIVGSAEIRVLPDSSRLALAIGLQVRLEHRLRDALTVPIAAEVTGLTNSVTVQLGRQLSTRLFGTATLGTASYSANSRYPAPYALGSIYRTYELPEYDLASRPAHPLLGAIGLRWTASPRTSLWLTAAGQHVSPSKEGLTASFGPSGSRSFVDLSVGVKLAPH
ncbi:MAG: hypothetical protein DMD40_13945 [Gemmatimonadetes bacterium]|nr:MAG: hypothetical protein DMD40_13945 [Gemmatimonadota bacterium]